MIQIRIQNAESKIVGHLPDHVHKALSDRLAYEIHGAHFIPKVRENKWDGIVRFYNKNKGQSFYSGLLALVRDELDKYEIKYQVYDNRVRPPKNYPELQFHPPYGFQNRPYQELTIDRSIKLTRGLLKVATGGGKTMIVSQIIARLQTYPFLFYVTTKDLMEQAYEVLSETLKVPIGRVGGGIFDPQKITVVTVQTAILAIQGKSKSFKISDYRFDEDDDWKDADLDSDEKKRTLEKLINQAKGIYFDEAHHSSAKTAKDVLTASPNAYWRYGGSATPYREDNAEIVIQALFGKKIVDISASYLIDQNYLLTPHIFFVPVEHDIQAHSYSKIYSECISNNEMLNKNVALLAIHLIQRKLSSLILVQRYVQGDMIKKFLKNEGYDVEFVTGKLSSKKRKEAIADLKSKKTLCMIATTLADEGLDVPTLDVAILAGGGASATRVNQRIGRTLRPDRSSSHPRDKSVVVCFDHKMKYLSAHTRKTKKIIKAEPNFKILKSKGLDFIASEIDKVMGFHNNVQDIFSIAERDEP